MTSPLQQEMKFQRIRRIVIGGFTLIWLATVGWAQLGAPLMDGVFDGKGQYGGRERCDRGDYEERFKCRQNLMLGSQRNMAAVWFGRAAIVGIPPLVVGGLVSWLVRPRRKSKAPSRIELD